MIEKNSEGNARVNYLLILGCQRSGTSLLSSILGAHPRINMRMESFDDNILKAAGKPINGNKLLLHRQIQLNRRANVFGHLVNRIINLGKKGINQQIRLFPLSKLSIENYIELNTRIIIIIRSKSNILNSMIKRSKFSYKNAEKEYKKAMDLVDMIKHLDRVIIVNFEELVTNPIDTIRRTCEWLNVEFDEKIIEGTKYNFIYPKNPIDPQKAC